MQANNEIGAEKRKGYNGAGETAMVRFQQVSEIISAQAQMMERAPKKIPLNDLPAIRQAADDFMMRCAEIGVIPTLLLFAPWIGHSRRNIYDYCERHRDSETAAYFDCLRTLWAGMRISAVDRGCAAESLSIFLLKNSGQNLTDAREIEIHPPENPLYSVSEEELASRYITGAVKSDIDD